MAEPSIVQLLVEHEYAAIARGVVRDVVRRLYGGDFHGLKASYDAWAFSGGKVPHSHIAEAVQFWFLAQKNAGIVFTRRDREEIDHEIEAHIRELCEED